MSRGHFHGLSLVPLRGLEVMEGRRKVQRGIANTLFRCCNSILQEPPVENAWYQNTLRFQEAKDSDANFRTGYRWGEESRLPATFYGAQPKGFDLPSTADRFVWCSSNTHDSPSMLHQHAAQFDACPVLAHAPSRMHYAYSPV